MTAAAQPIIIDLFAGGGGASMGIYMATGRHPDVAVNHDPKAIAMHKANHPNTMHVCQDIWTCPPRWACKGRTVALLHASPDCTHFSKAKGSAPRRDQKRRDLAWVIVKWCQEVRPQVVTMENVEEFTGWGPLDREGRPIASQAGQTFRAFINSLRRLGYAVQWRELRACDYGAPTIRKRLFLVARCDGRRIKWPRPTHGDPKSPAVRSGKLAPWRTAAECIDFTLPCPSIFERKRPLAEATLHRIAEGIQRYVVQAEQPFIVNLTHGGRLEDISAPIKTITAAHRGEKAFVEPYLVGLDQAGARSAKWPVEAPLSTVITKAKHGLVTSNLVKLRGTCKGGQPTDAPSPTVTSGGTHVAEVRTVCLMKYYGEGGQHSSPAEPMHTIPTKDRMAVVEARPAGGHAAKVRALLRWHRQGKLAKAWGWRLDDLDGLAADAFAGEVVLGGEVYSIADIGMRMLQPRELYRAQGFPDSYIIGDDPKQGLLLTKAEQVRMCGNSVSPPPEAAVVAANIDFGYVLDRGRELPLLGVGR